MQEGGKRPVVPLTITVMRCRDEVHLFAINKNAWPAASISMPACVCCCLLLPELANAQEHRIFKKKYFEMSNWSVKLGKISIYMKVIE